MDRAKQARENFLNGANCAQAVLAAFADEAGIDRDTALKIGSGLGGGMGRLREVCGAFSAAVIGTKSFMYDRLSSICAIFDIPDSTTGTLSSEAAKRIA